MNIEKFKKFFTENLPIELAYGYTLERKSLYIILYEDTLSRIVVDSDGNVLERLDQTEVIQISKLLESQKRIYHNRINETFKDFIDAFGESYLSITSGGEAQSEKRFDFEEVLTKIPKEQMTFKHFKVSPASYQFEKFIDGEFHGDWFEDSYVYNGDVFLLVDSRRKLSWQSDILLPITKEEFDLSVNYY
jgi:hypothetical protein